MSAILSSLRKNTKKQFSMILTGLSKIHIIEYLWKKHCKEYFPKIELDDDIFIDLQSCDSTLAGITSSYLKTHDLSNLHREAAQKVLESFDKYNQLLSNLDSSTKFFKRSTCLMNLILDRNVDLAEILLFDVIKIADIDEKQLKNKFTLNSINKDVPKIGDIATIVEVYESQEAGLGIELECFGSNNNGIPMWLNPFPMSSVRLEPLEK